jgi:hypothetical protein
MLDALCNIAIFALGLSAMFLIARKNKWGFVLGLASQPFWYITTYTHGQWGIFFLNFAYTFVWIYGVWEWFSKEVPPHPSSETS